MPKKYTALSKDRELLDDDEGMRLANLLQVVVRYWFEGMDEFDMIDALNIKNIEVKK